MNEWNIQARAHACQACGKGFADQQVYHTLLSDEKQQLIRLDVCDACWQTQYSQGANDRKGFISYWHGVYEAPPSAPPDAIRKETAESLLRKLIEVNDPQYASTGFILAVMLERKRLLKVKEQYFREGQRVFLYEQPKTGDLFTIPDPNLQLNQLEAVQRQVAELLEHGFPAPGQAPAAPAEPRPLGSDTMSEPANTSAKIDQAAAPTLETPPAPSDQAGQTPSAQPTLPTESAAPAEPTSEHASG
jgi:hypothetical protein